ncbi:FAD-dependent oxidoreductase [Paraburkholderia acidiphila]|nr:FAD-dependent oxidoreductase [Paraburkholderia acidiphila]
MTVSSIDRIGPFEYRRFLPSIPPLDGAYDATSHDVVIVGGGPVGLATALGLARHGVRSVVIEADDTVCEGSRAACISRRSLEILERLDAAHDFVSKGLPWRTGRSFYRNEEVLVFSMPDDGVGKFAPMINLQQYYIEHYLLQAIERRNSLTPGMIDVRWASSVTDMKVGETGVDLEIRNALGIYRCRAGWLVACDGGQSFVRNALGLSLIGTGYEGRYAIIDIELPSDAPTERRAWFDPPWWPGSTILMHQQPDNIWRIDYQLRPGDDPEAALTPTAVETFVQRHLDAIGEGHLRWRPVWTSLYRAGAMTLDSYRHGRILFAGNAAHAMPIFGVRGLNSGFDDADNLAWKLALVVRGCAPADLLESYSDERIAAFWINAESAMRSTEFMSPPSRGFDLMREACLSLAGDHVSIASLINPRQTRAVTYQDSTLSSDSDPFDVGPAPGAPAKDVKLPQENLYLSDLLMAPAFTVLVFGDDRIGRDLNDALLKTGFPVHIAMVASGHPSRDSGRLSDSGQLLREAYGARNGSVYLIRPDGHVAARWHDPTPDRVRGAIERACAINEGSKETLCRN